jgi:peroxiredoxin Q/BCP
MRILLLALGSAMAGATVLQAQDSGSATAFFASGPAMGSRAPDFSLPWGTKDGPGNEQWFSLSGQRGQLVVLAFYPADFTKGCTAEMQTFTERYDELFGEGVVVAGISSDSVDSHVRFAQSLGVPFKLLSDLDLAVARKYGSAGSEGRARRSVYLIDRNGKVAYSNLRFNALDPTSYSELKKAVQSARQGT